MAPPPSPADAGPEPSRRATVGQVIIWIIVCLSYVVIAWPVGFFVAILLYGWEGDGLLDRVSEPFQTPMAIAVVSIFYAILAVIPALVGGWAIPRHRWKARVVGALIPAVGGAGFYLVYLW